MRRVRTVDHATLHGFEVSCVTSGKSLISNCTFRVEPGELVALAGPNGAGKTTLLRAIAGMQTYQGTISHGEGDLSRLSRLERAALISYLPQGGQIHWPLSVYDVVSLGRLAHAGEVLAATEHNRTLVEHAMEAGMTLMPMIGQAKVLRSWGGIMDMSPDGSPIIDKTETEG